LDTEAINFDMKGRLFQETDAGVLSVFSGPKQLWYHTTSYCFRTGYQVCKPIDRFIRAFAKFRKVTDSLVMSVRPHGTTWPPLEGFS